MKLAEAQARTVLGKARVVAGSQGLFNEVRWVHIVDIPEILPWVRPGQLLLTTGYALPRAPQDQRALIRSLSERNLAGIGMAVPRFFENFPEPFREEADLLDLPLLEIPWEIPFALITEELHTQILAEQSYLIEQSEIIHRTLTRAALEATSIQDLATAFGTLIHRAVTFEDQDGHVLGYYTIQDMEDTVHRTSLEEGHSPVALEAHLTALGYTDAINRATAPLRIPPLPEFSFSSRIVCPIGLQVEFVGNVWIIEGTIPLSDLDLRAAEHAAVIAALQIAHQHAMASLESKVGYSFLSALLEGRFEATAQSIERAQLQGFDPEGTNRVGLLVMNEDLPLSRDGVVRREHLADRLRQQLSHLGIPPLISVSLNQIPFVLPADYDEQQVWVNIADPQVAFGLSRPYNGIRGIKDAYQEILAMLPHLTFGQLSRFEDLLLPRVLLGDIEARTAFLDEVFGPLKAVRNGAMLIDTLVTFAQSDFRLRKTADQLHIHPKSLKYRLLRIAEIARLDLREPAIRFRIQLATQLITLQTNESSAIGKPPTSNKA